MRARTAAAAALAVAAPVVAPAGTASAAYPGANGEIAYSAAPAVDGADPNRDVYAVAPDGSSPRRLTDDPAADFDPAWAPDGSRIAFASERSGDAEIYTMGPDGQDLVRLTESPGQDAEPTWSPDGTRIAFTSSRGGGQDVYVAPVEAPGEAEPLVAGPGADSEPAWSPDGTLIAFGSDREGPRSVWLAAADGSGARRLSPGRGARPDWAPSAQYVAYHSFTGESTDLLAASPAGPGEIALTAGSDYDFEPAFSPDGTALAFARGGELRVIDDVGSPPPHDGRTLVAESSARTPDWRPAGPLGGDESLEDGPLNVGNPEGPPINGHIAYDDRRDGDRDVFIATADGRRERRLTDSPGPDFDPAFSPAARFGGQRIAFVSGRDGVGDIYTMAADGSRVRRITHESEVASEPTWSPNGRFIAYATFLGGRNVGIAVVDAEGGEPRRISPCPQGSDGPGCDGFDRDPDWSPGGRWIAFARVDVGVCLMRPDGTGQVCPSLGLTPQNPAAVHGSGKPDPRLDDLDYDFDPAFMGDGTILSAAIEGDTLSTPSGVLEEGEFPAIFHTAVGGMGPGSDVRQLWYSPTGTGLARQRTEPEPSPDGELVAFASDESGGEEIVAVADFETGERHFRLNGTSPSWQALSPGWTFGEDPGVEPRRARRTARRVVRAIVRNENPFPVTGAAVVRCSGGVAGRERLRLPPDSSRRVTLRLKRRPRGRCARLRLELRLADPAGERVKIPGPALRGSRLPAWVRGAL